MKNIIYAVVGAVALYFLIQLATCNSKIPKELKASIDSLTIVNKKLMDSQQHMDSAIVAYEAEINQIDNHISHIKSQTTVVNKYYNDLGQQVDQYQPTQIDSFFKQRYNY
jgi:septal ring factor EnvC (AmiA/AmiB activator)